ncbi:daptide-type RiPP biosynthesis methyltransferase [Streptomyces sp. CoH27]|uniref:daptide-type RiPP biosynthesis methyltransferase n=1 Tax=Streptomyces sp. CoH27 TaxID=2875763 RepID=UPI001CD4AC1A|nr:daptide-type RiPP biosynthesis methyltransferase [Streptomyces sp. CoH27]
MTEYQLKGTAAALVELFAGKIHQHGMYDSEGASFYHAFTVRDNAEVEELLSAGEGRPGPVLELCCGSGRLTLPLLKSGFEVVGLDNSPSMLEILDERMREPEHQEYADRLSTVEGDMTDFSLDRTFGLIVLGATAVWNLTQEQRAQLFRCVREHLAEDGRFLLTVLDIAGFESAPAAFEYTSVFPTKDDRSPVLCTFIDRIEPDGLRSTSILANRVQDGEVVDTALYTAWTHLAPLGSLEKELAAEGLKLVAQRELVNRHQITRSSSARRRLLLEVTL